MSKQADDGSGRARGGESNGVEESVIDRVLGAIVTAAADLLQDDQL